jgi:hypothetical protein
MYKQIWPTTIFQGDISDEFPEEERLGLLEMSREFIKNYPYLYYKDHPYASNLEADQIPNVNPDLIYPDCPYLKKFKQILIEKIKIILQFDNFPNPDQLDIEALFLPRIVQSEWKGYRLLPHYHRGADYFCLFYMDLDVEEKKESIKDWKDNIYDYNHAAKKISKLTTTNGNLYLIDPVSQRSSVLGQDDVYRINPYPGLLVIHPTKIAHTTDPYYGEKDRCVFGASIRIVHKRSDPYYNRIS